MSKKARKKGRVITIVLILAIVFLAGIGALVYFQMNNLEALRLSRYSQEERESLLQQNEQAIIEALPVEPITPLTEEQEKMLQRGEITEDEALQMMMGTLVGNGSKPTEKPVTSVPSTPKEENQKLQELLARVYLLRSSFAGRLDGLIGQAKSEYFAQKKANGKADKISIGSKYIGKGLALEKECDGQMEALLAEIKAELERTGGDTSVVSQIRSSYSSEKSAKKAGLLNQYLK